MKGKVFFEHFLGHGKVINRRDNRAFVICVDSEGGVDVVDELDDLFDSGNGVEWLVIFGRGNLESKTLLASSFDLLL